MKQPHCCSASGTQIPHGVGVQQFFFSPVNSCILLIDLNWLCLHQRSRERAPTQAWHLVAHPAALVSSRLTRETPVCQQRAGRGTALPAVPDVASVLLSSPVVFTEKIIKAQDSHNLSLGGAACFSIVLHCHRQSRKPIKPGTNPICVFYSCAQYVSAKAFSFSMWIHLCQKKHRCSIYGVNVHTEVGCGKEVILLHSSYSQLGDFYFFLKSFTYRKDKTSLGRGRNFCCHHTGHITSRKGFILCMYSSFEKSCSTLTWTKRTDTELWCEDMRENT